MALELPAGRRSVSPESSGRDTPVPRQWRNQLSADEPLPKDKAFRKYAAGVDRALSLFETTLQEWADYISFLNRLLKALQARHAQTTAIPAKAVVAKRLSQCLNPSLPSGVHQKALEVYNVVFSIIGRAGLSRDLPLYLPGLAPTLSFASLSVRAHFLDLLERHFLDIDPPALRPALKSLILALLPGLEEETAEDFDRTLQLLNRFKAAVRPADSAPLTPDHATGDNFFWQCLFLATITSPSRRPGALAYLARYLPKLGQPLPASTTTTTTTTTPSAAPETLAAETALLAQLAALLATPEPGLLLRCFVAGLSDEQLLIQRGFLDLLVAHLPLHATVLQSRVKAADLEMLMRAACGVVTRREMSLNRRLTAWLLGPAPASADAEHHVAATPTTPAPKTSYFEEFGLQPLTAALLGMVQSGPDSTPAERARPYRICLSLMDRWEIGGLVVPEVFLPIVDSVRRFKDEAASKADFNEVLRSASVFFDGVESGLIYGEMLSLVAQALGPGNGNGDGDGDGDSKAPVRAADRADKLALVKFILVHFNVREEEMITIHAPLSALSVLCMLQGGASKPRAAAPAPPPDGIAMQALSLVADLLDLVPERAFAPGDAAAGTAAETAPSSPKPTAADILGRIRDFYVHDQGNLDTASPPYGPRLLAELLLQHASNLACQALLLDDGNDADNDDDSDEAHLPLKSRVLLLLLDKIPPAVPLDVAPLLSALHARLARGAGALAFPVFSSALSLAIHLHLSERIATVALSALVPALVDLAWDYLSAADPKYHVETVRSLWLLQTALGPANRDIEAALAQHMVGSGGGDVRGAFAARSADPGRRFAVLWQHTLQDSPQAADRRTPKTPRTPNGNLRAFPRLAGVDHFDLMLTRPLLLLLDALLDERTQLFMTAKAWLNTLAGLDRLFLVLAAKLLGLGLWMPRAGAGAGAGTRAGAAARGRDDDLDLCLYYLRTLSNVFRWAPEAMWAVLAGRALPPDSLLALAKDTGLSGTDVTYQELFAHICMRCILLTGAGDDSTDGRPAQLCRFALTVLHQILLNPHAAALSGLRLEDALLDRLAQSLQDPDPYIQVLLLDVLFAALKLREAAVAAAGAGASVASAAEEPSRRPPSSGEKRAFSGGELAKVVATAVVSAATAATTAGAPSSQPASSDDAMTPSAAARRANSMAAAASDSNATTTVTNNNNGAAAAAKRRDSSGHAHQTAQLPPASMLRCIQAGLGAPSSRPVLDSWVGFLGACLPLYADAIFQVLIPLVETLCGQIRATFAELQAAFRRTTTAAVATSPRGRAYAPDATLVSLLNALEQLLATAHQRLLAEEARAQAVKAPDQPQSFFGTIFASDAPQTRSATANDRLTVVLAFQDAVRMCFRIWSWGKGGGTMAPGPDDAVDATAAASLNYTSLRMRNRARRLLEHLFAAETLDCLETAVDLWRGAGVSDSSPGGSGGGDAYVHRPTDVFDLLLTLDAARPKHTIPALFNALYSRTNPGALDPARKSTLAVALADTDLVVFLVDYARALEDDAMDEIWQDCATFLKDLLGNPFPHRQVLPCLLEFAAVLGEKVDNTNFGEQRKLRRDLGDLFLRLLTALFTTRPIAFADAAGASSTNLLAGTETAPAAPSTATTTGAGATAAAAVAAPAPSTPAARADDVVGILSAIVPILPKVLVETDRVQAAAATISANVIGPTLRAKAFPDTVTRATLVLLQELSRLPNNARGWKKDVADAFNDPRFFGSSLALVCGRALLGGSGSGGGSGGRSSSNRSTGTGTGTGSSRGKTKGSGEGGAPANSWLSLLRQWAVGDKERMPELLSRITAPTTAGIVFGVGATSARLEADRRTQLNLRRVALLLVAAPADAFVAELPTVADRLVELLAASATSSPSATTRAEVYMVLRALVLRTSAVHLAGLWPVVDAELHAALAAIAAPPGSAAADTYGAAALLQACKLLDLLVCVAPDDFQLHEWLFVTDTIDAVYRPTGSGGGGGSGAVLPPVALADELAEALGSAATATATMAEDGMAAVDARDSEHGGGGGERALRRPLLGTTTTVLVGSGDDAGGKDELVARVLRPFFRQLSIYAFEATYAMAPVDLAACTEDLLRDVFDERTIVRAL